MTCPQCAGSLGPSRPGWYRCAACPYEISADAWRMHQGLMAALDADRTTFFERVKRRTAYLRSLEAAWKHR
ncbi:hypothetical protein [Streptomyces sp. NPDC002559]